MSETILIILDHKIREDRLISLKQWEKIFPQDQIFLMWGGEQADFDKLNFHQKLFIDDPRLRIADFQREKLSYTSTFKKIQPLLKGRKETYVLFVEGDCLPVKFNLIQVLESYIKAEMTDCIFSMLRRIDGTNHPHYLQLVQDGRFIEMLEKISVRKNKKVMLKSVGTPIFMKRELLDEFCLFNEPEPIHLEEYIPSLIYHLGFGVSNLAEHDKYSHFNGGDYCNDISDSALFIHPVKDYKGEWTIR